MAAKSLIDDEAVEDPPPRRKSAKSRVCSKAEVSDSEEDDDIEILGSSSATISVIPVKVEEVPISVRSFRHGSFRGETHMFLVAWSCSRRFGDARCERRSSGYSYA